MIINTGGRTDTVQYYIDWLLNRFKEGFVYSRNPFYPTKITRYELNPKVVDCVVFCSKNYEPILDRLNEITNNWMKLLKNIIFNCKPVQWNMIFKLYV